MALDLNKLTSSGTWRDVAKDVAYILVGTFVLSLGFVLFINPYKIVPGGVYEKRTVKITLYTTA